MSPTNRLRPLLICGVALIAAVAGEPVHAQFSGGFSGGFGSGSGGIWPQSAVLPENFPGVTLEAAREPDPDAPAVIDEAQFVPPKLQKPLTWEIVDLPLGAMAAEFSTRVGLPVLVDEVALKDVGIPLSEPLTGSIADVPAYLLLNRLLRGLGLTWDIEDDVFASPPPRSPKNGW